MFDIVEKLASSEKMLNKANDKILALGEGNAEKVTELEALLA